jgi:hypothetical protein
MSQQVAANVSVGVHNARTLSGTLPIERLVEELNRFGPDHMNSSILADEQLSGRLRISLTTAMTCAPFSQVWDGGLLECSLVPKRAGRNDERWSPRGWVFLREGEIQGGRGASWICGLPLRIVPQNVRRAVGRVAYLSL